MEVPKIEDIKVAVEANEAGERNKIEAAAPEAKRCIKRKDAICTSPDCKMEMCNNCPLGPQSTMTSSVKDLFRKIVNIAVFIAKSDDVVRDVMKMVEKGGVPEENKPSINENKVPSSEPAPIKKEDLEEEIVAERSALKISKANIKTVHSVTSSAMGDMAKQIGAKVKAISEELANPNHKPPGQLV